MKEKNGLSRKEIKGFRMLQKAREDISPFDDLGAYPRRTIFEGLGKRISRRGILAHRN